MVGTWLLGGVTCVTLSAWAGGNAPVPRTVYDSVTCQPSAPRNVTVERSPYIIAIDIVVYYYGPIKMGTSSAFADR